MARSATLRALPLPTAREWHGRASPDTKRSRRPCESAGSLHAPCKPAVLTVDGRIDHPRYPGVGPTPNASQASLGGARSWAAKSPPWSEGTGGSCLPLQGFREVHRRTRVAPVRVAELGSQGLRGSPGTWRQARPRAATRGLSDGTARSAWLRPKPGGAGSPFLCLQGGSQSLSGRRHPPRDASITAKDNPARGQPCPCYSSALLCRWPGRMTSHDLWAVTLRVTQIC